MFILCKMKLHRQGWVNHHSRQFLLLLEMHCTKQPVNGIINSPLPKIISGHYKTGKNYLFSGFVGGVIFSWVSCF